MKTTIRNHMNPREALGSFEHVVSKEYRSREKHVDPAGFYEVWENNGVYETYAEIFGEELEKFNAKQKRKDRRIFDEKGDAVAGYMEKIKADGRGKGKGKNPDGRRLLYEVVLSAGNCDKEYSASGRVIYDKTGHEVHPQAIPEEVNYRAVKRFYEGWNEMFPRLPLVASAWHGDEGYINARGVYERGTGHAHFCFIPVADGYKRGLPIQANIYNALEQMGYKAGRDASGRTRSQYYFFTQDIQKRFESILQDEWQKYREEKGLRPERLEIVHPDKGKDRANLSPEAFKEAQDNRAFARRAKADAEQYGEEASVNKAERDKYASGAKVNYQLWVKSMQDKEKAERETEQAEAKRDAVQKGLEEIQRKKQAGRQELEAVRAEIRQKQAERDAVRQETQQQTERLEQLRAEIMHAVQRKRQTEAKAEAREKEALENVVETRRLKYKAGEIVEAGTSLLDDLKALESEMDAVQRRRFVEAENRFSEIVAGYEAIHEDSLDGLNR